MPHLSPIAWVFVFVGMWGVFVSVLTNVEYTNVKVG